MLKSILKLEGAQEISKKQQKAITGGNNTGGCAYQWGGLVVIDASASHAESMATQGGGHWCCLNCCTASWTQGYGCANK